MDLAQALNAPEMLLIGGRAFPVRQLALAEWASLCGWLKTAAPSPLTQALRATQEAHDLGLPLAPELRDALFTHAQEAAKSWPPAFPSRAWLRALDSVPGGSAKFVQVVLAAGGTPLSDREAHDLYDRATADEVAELVRVAYYGDPPPPKPAARRRARPAATRPRTTTTGTPTTGGPGSSTSPPAAGRTRRSAG